jgi:LysR family glycine cleavage system transcriptional activator
MQDKAGKTPPLNALRAFEAAARHLSFVAAADELCVTPAAISHQIKGLEDYLGVALFKRLKRRVMLTDQGQLLLPELKQAFTLIERAMANLANDERRDMLTVSATPAFTAKWLLPRIHLFRERHPEIDVRLDATHELEDLERGQVDVAIRFGAGEYPGLECKPLRPGVPERVYPVCSPALLGGRHALKQPADLQHHTLLHDETIKGGGVLPSWQTWLASAGVDCVPANRGLRFNNSVLAIDAAINGQGVALSCGFVVADDLAAGRLVRPFKIPCNLDYNYFVVYPRNRAGDKVEKFYQWLVAMRDAMDEKANPGQQVVALP